MELLGYSIQLIFCLFCKRKTALATEPLAWRVDGATLWTGDGSRVCDRSLAFWIVSQERFTSKLTFLYRKKKVVP